MSRTFPRVEAWPDGSPIVFRPSRYEREARIKLGVACACLGAVVGFLVGVVL
jgi:hypothetical protein